MQKCYILRLLLLQVLFLYCIIIHTQLTVDIMHHGGEVNQEKARRTGADKQIKGLPLICQLTALLLSYW